MFSVACAEGENGAPFTTTLSADFDPLGLNTIDVGRNGKGHSRTTEVDEGGSSWNGIDVRWAIVPWTGTWDATVKRVVVDPTTGNVLAMGVVTESDIAEDQVDSFSGWVGMHAKEDGAEVWAKEFPNYDAMYGLDLVIDHGLVCFRGDIKNQERKTTACLSLADGSLVWERHFADVI